VGALDERVMTATDIDLQRAVEQFLFREARVIDANDYKTWMKMWADECMYWVPSNDDDSDPQKKVALIYDDRKQIEDRVWRLSGMHAHAQRPKSRLSRVISNIEVEQKGDEIVANSVFMLCEIRKNETRFWAGRNLHVLEQTEDGFVMKLKKVMLTNNDTVVSNLTFII
jgi:3-phenylpropionate/cinnamic acid dioxygenase small subunit